MSTEWISNDYKESTGNHATGRSYIGKDHCALSAAMLIDLQTSKVCQVNRLLVMNPEGQDGAQTRNASGIRFRSA